MLGTIVGIPFLFADDGADGEHVLIVSEFLIGFNIQRFTYDLSFNA